MHGTQPRCQQIDEVCAFMCPDGINTILPRDLRENEIFIGCIPRVFDNLRNRKSVVQPMENPDFVGK